MVSPIGLGKGAIYSVESQVTTATAQELRQATGGAALSLASVATDLQLPHPYPRVKALARSVTAGDRTTYDRVQSLIRWIGAHTRYPTDIPPLPAGADTVDEFLFGNRVGFCEQISTSLAVMLRSIDVPTREVVGYVPGSYNPITDLYQVRANDAHAWVQVWFPGYGWQNFDPTANVPLANPSPGVTALKDIGVALRRIPRVPIMAVLLVAALLTFIWRWHRTRPQSWAQRVARSAERAGRRAGHPRHAHETLFEFATALDGLSGGNSKAWRQLASPVEANVYGNVEPSLEMQRQLVERASQMVGRTPRTPRKLRSRFSA